MHRVLLFGVLTALLIWGWRELFTKRDRKFASKSARTFILPVAIALLVVGALAALSLGFNVKVF